MTQPDYERKAKQYTPNPVPPEERLIMAIWAAPLFAIALFWFGYVLFATISDSIAETIRGGHRSRMSTSGHP